MKVRDYIISLFRYNHGDTQLQAIVRRDRCIRERLETADPELDAYECVSDLDELGVTANELVERFDLPPDHWIVVELRNCRP